jgi:hypothetical protein
VKEDKEKKASEKKPEEAPEKKPEEAPEKKPEEAPKTQVEDPHYWGQTSLTQQKKIEEVPAKDTPKTAVKSDNKTQIK